MCQLLFQYTNTSAPITNSMAQAHLYLVLSVAIVMVFLASHSDACFITNCPPAGKRSLMPALASSQFHKECTRCGPALSGRCFGPSICCSPMTGCNIGGAMAARCALEAYSPQLCSNSGQACGVNGKGICALNATCCTSDGCFVDKNCTADSSSLESTL